MRGKDLTVSDLGKDNVYNEQRGVDENFISIRGDKTDNDAFMTIWLLFLGK